MRRAGYTFITDRHSGHSSYIRPFSQLGYPRFHVYLKGEGDELEINLHLDQKKPGYEGQSRHNAEYDGEVVAGEIARLQGLVGQPRNYWQATPASLAAASQEQRRAMPAARPVGNPLGHGKIEDHLPVEKKASWWKKIFS